MKEIEITISRKAAEELVDLEDKLNMPVSLKTADMKMSREDRIKKHMIPQRALFG